MYQYLVFWVLFASAHALFQVPRLDSINWSAWNNTHGNTTYRSEHGMITRFGEDYRVQGVNFNGIESDCRAPLGLWERDLGFFLDFLVETGFNSIRVRSRLRSRRTWNCLCRTV
jgi:hypothetical protein